MVSRSHQMNSHLLDVLLVFVALALSVALAWAVHGGVVVAAMLVGCGFAFLIVSAGALNLSPVDTRSEATERTLRVATNTLAHLRGGLTAENAQTICSLLLPETNATGIAITDTEFVLAFEGTQETPFRAGSRIAKPTEEAIASKRMETFVSIDQESQNIKAFSMGNRRDGSYFGIIVPLLVQDKAVGTLKFYYGRDLDIDRTQLAIAEGLGTLLSTQLSFYELDAQAELTARAEVKALQAQINPHFLFNTLNTIAAFTRTDPTRARDLLREFSLFYRRTLESSDTALIPLTQELDQTRRYLTIEKARFGEDRIKESEHIELGCEKLMVPSFLVQPIVENSVRHAIRDEGPLRIDIHVATDGRDVLIAVVDDGNGMTQAVANKLLADPDDPPVMETVRHGKGAGMALRNVADRTKRFYGVGSGVEIVSKPGEGTSVMLRLTGAVDSLVNNNNSANGKIV